jgi:hypothetical protein
MDFDGGTPCAHGRTALFGHFILALRRNPVLQERPSNKRAPVAQLDRVPDYESVGRRFESCRARQEY